MEETRTKTLVWDSLPAEAGFFHLAGEEPSGGARLDDSAPEAERLRDELQRLLAPLVSDLLRTPDGGLDLAKIPAKDFGEFKKFLADQAALSPAVKVGFPTVETAPYRNLLRDERFLPLLKLLYQRVNPQEFLSLSQGEAETLLAEFQRELIAIDAKAFAQSHLSSPSGRSRLSQLLTEPQGLTNRLRADLIRGITYAMKDQGRLSDLEYYQVSRLSALGPFQAFDFFNLFDSQAGLEPATRGALCLIESAAFFERETEKKAADFQARPWLRATLVVDEKLRTIDPKEIERFERLAEEMQSQADPASRAQGELAGLWLMAANQGHWDVARIGTAEVDRIRARVMRGAEAFLARAEGLSTREEFEAFTRELSDFLEAEVDPKRTGLDTSLQKLIQRLPASDRAPFDSLKHLVDTWRHSIEMGEWITIGSMPVQFQGETREEGNPLRREDVLRMIQGLEQTKHELWYGYKRHKLAGRLASAMAEPFGAGDREDIREANREINRLIYRLSEAESREEIDQAAAQLFESLKEGGALYRGLKASAMDFNEQLIGLGQTIAIMAALGLATRGLSLLGQGGVALLRSAGVMRAAATAEAAAGTAAETATIAERVVHGFQLGAQLSLAENAVATASGEVRQGPETAEGWAKDALATGTSMAFTGLLPVSHAAQGNLFKNVWTRYTAGTARGLKFLALDTATEAVEEGIDDLARRAMDGDTMAIDPTQARNLLALSLAGGGLKVGTAAEILKGAPQKIPSPLVPHPLTHPLLSPATMLLGAGGIGGIGGKSRRSSAQRAAIRNDPRLKELDESLLALQVKNPKDPRVETQWAVIADRLQELGDPRGEWIALELEGQRLRAQGGGEYRLGKINAEIRRIRKKVTEEIQNRFNREVRFGFGVETGFELENIGHDPIDFLKKFTKSEYGCLLRRLSIGPLRTHQSQWIASSPAFRNLISLSLAVTGIGGIRAIAASETLRNLTSLHLVDVDREMGDEGARVIAASENFRNLAFLDLGHTGIGDEGVRTIAASQTLRNLTSLYLQWNEIGDEGVRAIATSQTLRNLTSLNLMHNRIGDEGAHAIALSESLHNLARLDLRYNEIRRGGRAILNSPRLPHLVELNWERVNRPPRQEGGEDPQGGPLHAFAAPALFGLDVLLHGQPTATGIVAAGMATLASAGMVSGVFSKMAEWAKDRWFGEGSFLPQETFALGFTSDSHSQNDPSAGEQEDDAFSVVVDLEKKPSDQKNKFERTPPNPSRLLESPILTPFWMFMGAGGLGGGERRPGKVRNRGSTIRNDLKLRELDNSLLALQVKKPKAPQVQEYFAVISDCLQELGDPRGEWIALELERQRLLSHGDQTGRLAEVDAKLAQIHIGISQDIRSRFGPDAKLRFANGFHLHLDENPDPINVLKKFLASEYSLLFRGLDIFNDIEFIHDRIYSIAAATGLSKLTELSLYGHNIGNEGARIIANNPSFKNLVRLIISPGIESETHHSIRVEGARAIATSKILRNLTSLDLGWNKIGNEGARAIASSKTLHKLTSLDLRGNLLSYEGVRAIATSPTLGNLTFLNLEANAIGDEGARVIAASATLRSLTHLNLKETDIRNDGARAITTSPTLGNLTYLNLSRNEIGDEVEQEILESPHLPNLVEFNGEKIERSPEQGAGEYPQGRPLHAFAAPALFGLDVLLHGQPTATGALIAGLATLASGGMALGVFGRVGNWLGEIKDRFLGKEAVEPPGDSKEQAQAETVRHPQAPYRANALGEGEIKYWIKRLKSENEAERWVAATHLTQSGSQEAIEGLRTLLGSEASILVRLSALEILAALGDPEATNSIVDILRNRRFVIAARFEAMSVLRRMNPERALDEARRFLLWEGDGGHPFESQTLLAFAADCLAELGCDADIPMLRALLCHGELKPVLSAAIRGLRLLGAHEARGDIQPFLRHRFHEVRREAFHALNSLEEARVADEMLRLLREGNASERSLALEQLEHSEYRHFKVEMEMLKILREAVKHSDPEIAFIAAEALAKRGYEEGYRHLKGLFQVQGMRGRAAMFFKHHGMLHSIPIPELRALLREASPSLRETTVLVLRDLKAIEAIEDIQVLLNDENERVRSIARDALEDLTALQERKSRPQSSHSFAFPALLGLPSGLATLSSSGEAAETLSRIFEWAKEILLAPAWMFLGAGGIGGVPGGGRPKPLSEMELKSFSRRDLDRRWEFGEAIEGIRRSEAAPKHRTSALIELLYHPEFDQDVEAVLSWIRELGSIEDLGYALLSPHVTGELEAPLRRLEEDIGRGESPYLMGIVLLSELLAKHCGDIVPHLEWIRNFKQGRFNVLLGKALSNPGFEGDFDFYMALIRDSRADADTIVAELAAAASNPHFRGDFAGLIQFIQDSNASPEAMVAAIGGLLSHPNYHGPFNNLIPFLLHADVSREARAEALADVLSNPHFDGDRLWVLQLIIALPGLLDPRLFPERLPWLSSRALLKLLANPQMTEHFGRLLDYALHKGAPFGAEGFDYVLRAVDRHETDAQFLDYLPTLEIFSKFHPRYVGFIAHLFAHLASAPGLHEGKRVALLDAILGGFFHKDPRIRLAFIHMSSTVTRDTHLSEEVRAWYRSNLEGVRRDTDPKIRAAAEAAWGKSPKPRATFG